MDSLSIGLACNLGASTSILVNKMKSIVKESEKLSKIDVRIDAFPVNNIDESIRDYQVIMLGPQIGHRKTEIEEKVKKYNIPVTVIDSADYGSMNAKNILKEAIYIIKNS